MPSLVGSEMCIRDRYQPWQPTKVRGNCHGNFRGRQTTAISAAIATAILRYAAISMDVRGKYHGNFRGHQSTAISTVIRGHPRPLPRSCHGNFRGCQTTATFTAIRGHPRPLPRQSSDTRQLPRKSTPLPRQFPRASNHSNFHGHPRQSSDTRQLSRKSKSTAIATAISMAIRGHPRQLNYHVNRRQFLCNHGSYNGNPR